MLVSERHKEDMEVFPYIGRVWVMRSCFSQLP